MSELPGTPLVWCNGAVLPADEIHLSPFDHGILVGDGVFETMRIYDATPFAWTRHLARLAVSAEGLELPRPDAARLREATAAVIAANHITEGRVRITITGGPSPLGSERGDHPPTVIVAVGTLAPWPATTTVVNVPWSRNERGATAGLKTISYAENVRALAYAHERDAGEAMFANTRGELCEATGSNVFCVEHGVVRTPPAAAGCLLGVTRALVLELCVASGLAAEEATLPAEAIASADEAFLTSSTREVHPISAVDGIELPAAPGPITTQLAEAFRALVAHDLDP